MLVLSLDSSTVTASVSLADGERLLSETVLNVGTKHSTTLLPAVKSLLDFAGVGVSDIGLFALSAGPGSFTGVRIGAAAVKGLALGTDVPCVGVSTIAAMAEGLCFADSGATVCPLIAARHDRYYTAMFSVDSGVVTRRTDDDVLEGAAVEEYLTASGGEVYLCGDGVGEFLECHGAVRPKKIPETLKNPSAYYAGVLALRRYNSASEDERRGFTAGALRPIYLRPPQVERQK